MQIQTLLHADADHIFLHEKKKKKGQLTVLASFQAATDTFGRNQIKARAVQPSCVWLAHQINAKISGELHSCRRKTNLSV